MFDGIPIDEGPEVVYIATSKLMLVIPQDRIQLCCFDVYQNLQDIIL